MLSHPPQILRFSSVDLPEKDRVPYWREVFGRNICGCDIEPLTDEPFRSSVTFTLLPDCSLAYSDASYARYLRTPAQLADSRDDLVLSINLDGTYIVQQCRREIVIPTGDAFLGTTGEAGYADVARHLDVAMPLRRFRALVPGIEDRIAERVPSDTALLHLIKGHLHNWQNGALATTPVLAQTFSDHFYDLVALLFGARGDVAHQAAQRGGREALRAMIAGEIDRHFHDPDFSLPTLAKRVGVGPRYVQMLLAEADSSFVKEVTRRRLERAHALLRSPRHRHLSILDIAYECGFNTKTNFNQMFRRSYSATPGEVREGLALGRQ